MTPGRATLLQVLLVLPALPVLAPWDAPAGEIPDAIVALEVLTRPLPGQVPEAAPPRFVLMEDGHVFVGGTSRVWSARLEKDEVRDIERQASRIRKLSGLGSSVTLGPGGDRRRLTLRKGKLVEIVATGDLKGSPAALKPLASFLEALASFSHPSLRPYKPLSYALAVREGTLPGGCRPWGFSPPLTGSLSAVRSIPAAAASGWPTGAIAASVCEAEKRYVVTLRPLLPGERP